MLSIHVGCLPSNTTEEALWNYFSYFGLIIHLQIEYRHKDFCSGSASVTCGSETVYQSILKYQGHEFFGRKIYCTRLLKGQELVDQTKAFRSKRVYLSNVPYNLSDKDLEFIFSEFGEVENAYRIVSFAGKKMPFGYLTFKHQESSRTAVEAGYLLFNNKKIGIEPFKRKTPGKETNGDQKSPKIKHTTYQENTKAYQKGLDLYQKDYDPVEEQSAKYKQYQHHINMPLHEFGMLSKPTQKIYHESPTQDLNADEANLRFALSFQNKGPAFNLKKMNFFKNPKSPP